MNDVLYGLIMVAVIVFVSVKFITIKRRELTNKQSTKLENNQLNGFIDCLLDTLELEELEEAAEEIDNDEEILQLAFDRCVADHPEYERERSFIDAILDSDIPEGVDEIDDEYERDKALYENFVSDFPEYDDLARAFFRI